MEKPSETEFYGKKSDKYDQEDANDIRDASTSSSPRYVFRRFSHLDDTPMCRICYSGSSHERLLRPCKCKGTLEYVHRTCLEIWLETSNLKSCELCSNPFTTKRTCKSFWEWCNQPETFRMLTYDCTITLSAILSAITVIICDMLQPDELSVWQKLELLWMLVTIKWTIMFAYVCARRHLKDWLRWRDSNWNVRIVDRQTSDEHIVITIPDPPPTDPSSKQPFIGQPLPPFGDRRAPQEPPGESGHFMYTSQRFTV